MKLAPASQITTDLLLSFSLLSRLPVPHVPDAAFERAAHAVWAYPLVGAALGAIGGSIAIAGLWLGLPVGIAAGILLAVLMFTTGAMHEDGLADTADGFWGGYTVDRRLEIMKDSQIGTYGTLSLIVMTGLRWVAYAAILPIGLAPICAAAILSRACMPVLMAVLPNARATGLSHSVGRPQRSVVLCALALGIGAAILLLGWAAAGSVLAVGAVTLGVFFLSKTKINGQTGDVLGATQQLCELAILAAILVQLT